MLCCSTQGCNMLFDTDTLIPVHHNINPPSGRTIVAVNSYCAVSHQCTKQNKKPQQDFIVL